MNRWHLGFTIGLVGALVAACGDPSSDDPVSTTEADSLVFAREEEKLARDVYGALTPQDPIFTNIQRSEQTHMDAILTLLDRYEVGDPAAAKPVGAFTNPTLQKLHDDLVLQGNASRTAALTVGVEIEELDIHDINAMRATTDHSDMLNTFDNLTRGSRNHLRSFYGQLRALGGAYTPKHLDAAAFEAIVSSPMETGGPNR